MAIVKEIVVKEGYEEFHSQAVAKLETLDASVETKVAEYREKVLAENEVDREKLNKIIELCTEEIEKEVPDEQEVVENTEEQPTEQL